MDEEGWEGVSQTQRVASGRSFWDTNQPMLGHIYWPPARTLLTHWGTLGAMMTTTGIWAIREIVLVTSLLEVVNVFWLDKEGTNPSFGWISQPLWSSIQTLLIFSCSLDECPLSLSAAAAAVQLVDSSIKSIFKGWLEVLQRGERGLQQSSPSNYIFQIQIFSSFDKKHAFLLEPLSQRESLVEVWHKPSENRDHSLGFQKV